MRKDSFNELLASVQEMKAIQAGRLKPGRVTRVERTGVREIAALRAKLKLSQARFAPLLGVSVDALKKWEERRQSKG